MQRMSNIMDMSVSEMLRQCFDQWVASIDLSTAKHQIKERMERRKQKLEILKQELNKDQKELQQVKAKMENAKELRQAQANMKKEHTRKAVKDLVRSRRRGHGWQQIRLFASNQPVVTLGFLTVDELVLAVKGRLRELDELAAKDGV